MLKKIDHSQSHLGQVLNIFGENWSQIQYSKTMDGQNRIDMSLLHRAVFDVARGTLNTLNFVRVIGSHKIAWNIDLTLLEHFLSNFMTALSKEFNNLDTSFSNYYKNIFNFLFYIPNKILNFNVNRRNDQMSCHSYPNLQVQQRLRLQNSPLKTNLRT